MIMPIGVAGRRQRQQLILMLGLAISSCVLLSLALSQVAAAAAATTTEETQHHLNDGQLQQRQQQFMGGLKLSKLFDFSEYKRLYGKRYSSAVQELARMKLYLGGVLRVLIAGIKHLFFGKKYYLAVNRMTDWTEAEWHQVSVEASVMRGESDATSTSADGKAERFEVAELSDIDTKLPEVFNGQEESLQKFVDEIVENDYTDNDGHKLSANMLFRSPASRTEGDIYAVPRSNNPRYEQPEVMSQSSADETTERPLKKEEAQQISDAGTAGIFDYMLDGLSYLFNAADQDATDDKKIEAYSEGPDEIFVDHRQSGCLRPPSHQLECGSCYAFASLALYEYLYCMQRHEQGHKREPVQFSPQYLIDCGPAKDQQHLKGCKGGNPIKVAEFVNKYGLELEVNYPYAAEQQVCPYDDDAQSEASMGYIRVDEPGLEILRPVDIDDMLKKKPVLINIYPNSELKFYGGGIYDNYACEFKYGHAMLLVGSGRKDNQEYWIIRNSLGAEWGEQGYLYISKGAALNCMVDDGSTSHAKFPLTSVNSRYSKKTMAKLLP